MFDIKKFLAENTITLWEGKTAVIKRKKGSAHQWDYTIYVNGKPLRGPQHSRGQSVGSIITVFDVPEARRIAGTEDDSITHVRYDWSNQTVELTRADR